MYTTGYYTPTTSAVAETATWLIVSLVVAIIGGICVYFCFLTKDNENKLTGFAKWLYDFLSFKKLFAETLLKISYLILAILVTLSSLSLVSTSFIGFVVMLVLGNVGLRLAYEFSLTILLICSNVSQINSKLQAPVSETKKEVKVKKTEVKTEE